MKASAIRYENVAVSTRIRLARNFADYPFPRRLGKPAAREIIGIVSAALREVDAFELHYMDGISLQQAELYIERYQISRDLWKNREISAVLFLRQNGAGRTFEKELSDILTENVSVMINEEDHIRAQYFVRGFDLKRGYERLSGIDEIIAETIPFACDSELGYLTACPTNLGTGLRASVMLFLPALARRGRMREITAKLKRKGLTVRGMFGEGSVAEGDLYQISNEVTLGARDTDILSVVERDMLEEEGGMALTDRILRSYGILTNCAQIDAHEFLERLSDVKLGVALGMFEGEMSDLDTLLVSTRPANLGALAEKQLTEEQDIFRANYAGRTLRRMCMLDEELRGNLFPKE